MSILDPTPQPVISQSDQVAARLRRQTVSIHKNMVCAFNDSARMFWSNPSATPVEIATSLGVDAGEMFALHAKLGILLAEISPESIVDGTSVVGEFVVNGDGTVTVQLPVEPVS